MKRVAPLFAVVALLVVACGTDVSGVASNEPTAIAVTGSAASAPSPSSGGDDAAATAIADPSGQLAAGQAYVTTTDPPVGFTVDEGWTAIPAAGGVGLLRGSTRAWITAGMTSAYVGRGTLEEAAMSAAEIAAQVARNQRLDVSEARPTELGGATGVELDATVPYDLNVEGGGPIFDTERGTIQLPDLTRSRIYFLDVDGVVVSIIVAGPEEESMDDLLDDAAPILDSITFP